MMPDSPDWMLRGACRGVDPELFFPVRGDNGRPAKKVCFGCEVREECLEYALVNGEKWGVWGGMAERERRKIRRRRFPDRTFPYRAVRAG